jgi:signal transduction histidine kinase
MQKKWLLILGSLVFTTLLYFFWWHNPLLTYLDYKVYDRLTHTFPSPHTPASTVIIEINDKSLKELGQWPWPRMITAKLIETVATAKPSAIVLDMVFSERDRTSPSTLKSFYSTVLNHDITIGGLPDGLQDNDAILSDVIRRSPMVLPVFVDKDAKNSVCILPNTVTFHQNLQNADLYTINNLVCSLPAFQERSHGTGHIHVATDEDGILRRLSLAMKHQDRWIPALGAAAVASVTPGIHFDSTSPFLGGMKLDIGNRHFFADQNGEALLNFYPLSRYEKISAVDILSGAVDVGGLKGKYVFIGSTALGLDSTYILSDESVCSGVFVHAMLVENILNNDLGVQASLYKTLNFSASFMFALLLLLQMIKKRYLVVVIMYLTVSVSAVFVAYMAWQHHIYISIGFFIIPLSAYLFALSLLMFFIDYRNKKIFIDKLQRSSEQKRYLQTALTQSESEVEHQKAMLHQKSKLAAMGEMFDNIAHQWRQPLNLLGTIIQHAEFAFPRGKVDEAYIRKMSADSMAQIIFMSQTIDDFRNFVKPDRQNIHFDLNRSIKESLRLLDGMFSSNGITISVKYSDDMVIAMGSPSEFKQVVINLLQNARDALMEHNQTNPLIQICIFSEQTDAILTIEDNGGGIPAHIIERIFEPYFTTKEEGVGSGIGLHISNEIIRTKMGGKIDVSNTRNGAQFTITLPLSVS